MVCSGGGFGAIPTQGWERIDCRDYVDDCLAYGTYAGSTHVCIGNPTPLGLVDRAELVAAVASTLDECAG